MNKYCKRSTCRENFIIKKEHSSQNCSYMLAKFKDKNFFGLYQKHKFMKTLPPQK